MEEYWADVLEKAKQNRHRRRRGKCNRTREAKKTLKKRSSAKGVFVGTYVAYLKSPQWARKRRKVRQHYGNRCTVCGSTHNLQVHHRHYRTLFREAMTDLDLLCCGCHQNHHETDGKAMDPMTREFLALQL